MTRRKGTLGTRGFFSRSDLAGRRPADRRNIGNSITRARITSGTQGGVEDKTNGLTSLCKDAIIWSETKCWAPVISRPGLVVRPVFEPAITRSAVPRPPALQSPDHPLCSPATTRSAVPRPPALQSRDHPLSSPPTTRSPVPRPPALLLSDAISTELIRRRLLPTVYNYHYTKTFTNIKPTLWPAIAQGCSILTDKVHVKYFQIFGGHRLLKTQQ